MPEAATKLALAAAGGAAAGALVAYKFAPRPYKPPKKWTAPAGGSGGKWSKINAETSGAREEKALPKGAHAVQLYSLGTPNGVKVTILLEELCGVLPKFDYDAWLTKIDGEQFGSDFVGINPNSKIPALFDSSTGTRVFESGSILLYLCDTYDRDGLFLAKRGPERPEALNWVFWQMGCGGYVGGGFGHFFNYAPVKIEYAIDRFTMELKRQLHLLDAQLSTRRFVAGDTYTIADMAIYPWYGKIAQGSLYGAKEFLDMGAYPNLGRWADEVAARPGVARGNKVNRTWGKKSDQLHDRHSRADFDALPKD